jgi:alanine racemase
MSFIHSISVRALAKNSSFGFSALAYVSAKTKCAVCAVGYYFN